MKLSSLRVCAIQTAILVALDSTPDEIEALSLNEDVAKCSRDMGWS